MTNPLTAPGIAALLLAFACTGGGTASAANGDVSRLLECRDSGALLADWDALRSSLGSTATCRESRYASGSELECRAPAAFSAYGLPLQEFSLRESSGGTRQLRGVFKASAEGLRAAAARFHHGIFEPDGANGWRLNLSDGDAQWLHVDLREDGASELTCAANGGAEASRRAGADSAHGAIAGRLAFPTSPLPPMRVCAVPADAANALPSPHCTLTAEGTWSFLIGSVPPGEYFVLAWPQRDNPNRYVMAHAASLQHCAPHEPGCAGGMLERVYVHAGEVLRGIDALQPFTDLPPALAEPPR